VKTDEEGISSLYTARSAGYLLGALSGTRMMQSSVCAITFNLGGFFFNMINRQVCLIALIMIMASSLFAMSFATELWLLNTIAFVNGFSSGGSDTAINVYVLELWGAKCGPFIQALYFCFALGTGSAPLITAPFLTEFSSQNETSGNYSIDVTHPDFQNCTLENCVNSNQGNSGELRVPFGISAVVIGAASVCLFLAHWLLPHQTRTNRVPTEEPENRSKVGLKRAFITRINDYRTWLAAKENHATFVIITLYCLIILVYSGMEIIYFEFLPKFLTVDSQKLVEPLNERQASYLYSVMNYSYTISRGIGVLVAVFCKTHVLIYIDCMILTIASSVLLIFSGTKFTYWIGNILMGCGFATVYASLYAFIEEFFEMTNIIGALFVFSSGLTAVVYPVIIGKFIATHPLSLILLVLVSILITLILFSIVFLLLKRRQVKNRVIQ